MCDRSKEEVLARELLSIAYRQKERDLTLKEYVDIYIIDAMEEAETLLDSLDKHTRIKD